MASNISLNIVCNKLLDHYLILSDPHWWPVKAYVNIVLFLSIEDHHC